MWGASRIAVGDGGGDPADVPSTSVGYSSDVINDFFRRRSIVRTSIRQGTD